MIDGIFSNDAYQSAHITDFVDPTGQYTQRFVDAGIVIVNIEGKAPYTTGESTAMLHRVCLDTAKGGIKEPGVYQFVTFVGKACPNLAEFMKSSSPLSLHDALIYTSGLCAGLAHLHEQGVQHLQICPQNVLVSETGGCKFTNFSMSGNMRGMVQHAVVFSRPSRACGLASDLLMLEAIARASTSLHNLDMPLVPDVMHRVEMPEGLGEDIRRQWRDLVRTAALRGWDLGTFIDTFARAHDVSGLGKTLAWVFHKVVPEGSPIPRPINNVLEAMTAVHVADRCTAEQAANALGKLVDERTFLR
jgi:serine/threonine protein kinase